MLSNKPMTKKESHLRANYLRRENLKKIKTENGDAYQHHLKTNKERDARRRKKIKEDPITYQKEMARVRNAGKRYRDRLKENDKAYCQHKAKNADEQRRRRKLRIRILHEAYLRKLLLKQGFEKDEITKELVEVKRLYIKTKRLVLSNKKILKEVLETIANKTSGQKVFNF